MQPNNISDSTLQINFILCSFRIKSNAWSNRNKQNATLFLRLTFCQTIDMQLNETLQITKLAAPSKPEFNKINPKQILE